MNHKNFVATLALGIGGITAAYAAPVPAKPSPWILADHHVIAVAPYVVERPRGPRKIHENRAVARELRGAAIFVRAEPELTPEWLQLTVSRQIADIRRGDLAHSAVDETDVQVKVTSVGTAFCVYLIAKDPTKAGAVLRRARFLSVQ